MSADNLSDPNAPEFIEAMYNHLVSIGADRMDPEGFKRDYEKQLADAKAKYSKKETKVSGVNVNSEKIAALQNLVGTYYVPAFVKACSDLGLEFESSEDLAHALQINGKCAAMVGAGVSIDTLVDTIVSGLNVKHASEGGIKISLAAMNHAFDDGLEAAGIPVDPMNKAASADLAGGVSDDELIAYIDAVS
jgi:hypothetical protein